MKTDQEEKKRYSDKELNELAEWLQDLSLDQAFFIKQSYEGFLKAQAQTSGCEHVH